MIEQAKLGWSQSSAAADPSFRASKVCGSLLACLRTHALDYWGGVSLQTLAGSLASMPSFTYPGDECDSDGQPGLFASMFAFFPAVLHF